jgi:DNA-binding MarR family transcriptional regulator
MENDSVNEFFSEKATIASITKRLNAMKILLFLSKDSDNEEVYYLQELADRLEMNESTTFANLCKLMESGLIEKKESKANRKNKYYSILNKNLAEKVIEKYKHWVAFCIARLVPYQRLYASQLKRDKRFIEACEEYGLTVPEGIYAILSCYKVGKESAGLDTIIWRRAQGYDEPESGKPITEVEEI